MPGEEEGKKEWGSEKRSQTGAGSPRTTSEQEPVLKAPHRDSNNHGQSQRPAKDPRRRASRGHSSTGNPGAAGSAGAAPAAAETRPSQHPGRGAHSHLADELLPEVGAAPVGLGPGHVHRRRTPRLLPAFTATPAPRYSPPLPTPTRQPGSCSQPLPAR